MTERSIFFDEWQACLRAHYQYVICAHDPVTEPTLRRVLLQTGIREDEIIALQTEALSGDEDCFGDEIPLISKPEVFEVLEVIPPEPPVEEEVIEEQIDELDEPEAESDQQWPAHGPQQLSLF
jgi:hypothetical protein